MTGIEGGFSLDEHSYEVEETNTIVVMPSWKDIPLTDPELPIEVGHITVELPVEVGHVTVLLHS